MVLRTITVSEPEFELDVGGADNELDVIARDMVRLRSVGKILGDKWFAPLLKPINGNVA